LAVDKATQVLKTGLTPRPKRQRAATTPAGRETTIVRRLFVRGRRLVTDHVVSSAAAVLALVLLAGLMTAVDSVRSPVSGPMVPAAHVKLQSVDLTPAAPAAPSVTADLTVQRPTPPSDVPVTTTEASSVRGAAVFPSPRPAAVAQTASLEVVHLHRFGDCRGRLDVKRDGVAFVSAEENAEDAFALKFEEFLHAVSDDTLTLRSATKTYRFKAQQAGGESKLRELAERISRARR
jgi:hypothetical protein